MGFEEVEEEVVWKEQWQTRKIFTTSRSPDGYERKNSCHIEGHGRSSPREIARFQFRQEIEESV